MGNTKRRVLVVDDDKLILTMLSDILRKDYDVVTASDGEEALRILRKTEVVAFLSDQIMPGPSGIEVLEQCAVLQPKAARILVTATDRVEDLRDAVNIARVHSVVVKPVREVEILGIVGGAVRERQLEEENERLLSELQDLVQRLQERERELEAELKLRTQELREVVARVK